MSDIDKLPFYKYELDSELEQASEPNEIYGLKDIREKSLNWDDVDDGLWEKIFLE